MLLLLLVLEQSRKIFLGENSSSQRYRVAQKMCINCIHVRGLKFILEKSSFVCAKECFRTGGKNAPWRREKLFVQRTLWKHKTARETLERYHTPSIYTHRKKRSHEQQQITGRGHEATSKWKWKLHSWRTARQNILTKYKFNAANAFKEEAQLVEKEA